MDLLMAAADVVVCRSGGTTVAELAVIGLPAILVPLPIAPRDHQRANANVLVAAGAAVLVDDSECRADRLATELGRILEDDDRRATMTAAAASVGRPDAADAVADLAVRAAAGERW
jgi:UDP-N-acetylglucosamine:LPS N-acetylglucosamine transferase